MKTSDLHADLNALAHDIRVVRTTPRHSVRMVPFDNTFAPHGGVLPDEAARNLRLALGHLRSAEALVRMALSDLPRRDIRDLDIKCTK